MSFAKKFACHTFCGALAKVSAGSLAYTPSAARRNGMRASPVTPSTWATDTASSPLHERGQSDSHTSKMRLIHQRLYMFAYAGKKSIFTAAMMVSGSPSPKG